MAIQETDGSIIINHSPTPKTLAYAGEDRASGIEKFHFSDSTLAAEHVLYKRDYGRKVAGPTATRKGKITIVQEKQMADGTRRTFTLSVNLIAHSDFVSDEVKNAVADLGQFLLDNQQDLADGKFDS